MITERDFASITAVVERVVAKLVGGRQSFFTTGTVIKRDKKKKLVWLKEYGPQAIPVVGLRSTVTYYDTDSTGKVTKKLARVDVEVPRQGETVLVCNEWGMKRMPRCLGVIQGKGWNE